VTDVAFNTLPLVAPKLYSDPNKFLPDFDSVTTWTCGPGSSVGIATDYGLDGPGSNPGRDEISHPSRPAQGPTQPPVQWVQGLPRG